ncbi:hypothetical protein ACHQM5_008581 [Ranunculus cassubicifolius]
MESEVGEGGRIIQGWLKKPRSTYTKATKHPFILSIKDGSINLSSFKRWLFNCILSVRSPTAFQRSD